MPLIHSGAETVRPETTNLILLPSAEVVHQHPQEIYSKSIYQTSTTKTYKKTHMRESKQRNDVQSQTSPMKETSPQVSGSSSEPLLGNQAGSTPVQCPNDSKKPQSELQRHEMNIIANDNGDDKISPPKITYSQIEEQLVRDDITNELYMPLSSTIVLKRKKEMLYVPLGFENVLTTDALVESRAYVSAIAQTEMNRIKQQAPANIFRIDDPPSFEIQVAIDQLERPISTTTLKFDIGDNTFAKHFVILKK